jgi:dihydrofolate reductase
MTQVKCQISVSLDGYAAGPNQSEEHGLGEGGEGLHEWLVKLPVFDEMHGRPGGEEDTDNPSEAVFREAAGNTGAVVMGRNMFGPVRGEWGDSDWRGWWGEEPPFHTPVYVLTHHEREPLEMEGGTTFHFITEGVERAVELARESAGERDVAVAGGAATIQQCLRAGLFDELLINLAPVMLGDGERLLDGLGGLEAGFEPTRAVAGPEAVHLFYRVTQTT